MPAIAAEYQKSITQLKKTIIEKYWDKEKKLFADREEKDVFSQHTNALAILTGVVSQSDIPELSKQLLRNPSLAPASIYFKYYLHQALVKEQKLFSNIECYHYGSVDRGLLTIDGKLVKGIKMEDAEKAVETELERMRTEKVTTTELQKVKNKVESLIAFEDMSLTNRANSLAFYELLGDAEQMNHELEKYNVVTTEDILNESRIIFRPENSNTLYYYSKN
jgi:predicted Zn-dependent peptidase